MVHTSSFKDVGVAVDWRKTARPHATRALGGGSKVFTQQTPHRGARDSVRVYDSQNGSLLVEFPVEVNSPINQSLTWASVALSRDGYIHDVDGPPRLRCRNGAFTTPPIPHASPWQATAHLLQPPQPHRSLCGMQRHTSKSGLSLSTLIISGPWV